MHHTLNFKKQKNQRCEDILSHHRLNYFLRIRMVSDIFHNNDDRKGIRHLNHSKIWFQAWCMGRKSRWQKFHCVGKQLEIFENIGRIVWIRFFTTRVVHVLSLSCIFASTTWRQQSLTCHKKLVIHDPCFLEWLFQIFNLKKRENPL